MTTATDQYVTWPQLLEWAKAHGALNDRITSIEINTTMVDGEMRGVVSLSGWALNDQGRPYTLNSKHEAARWQVTNQMLRYLP